MEKEMLEELKRIRELLEEILDALSPEKRVVKVWPERVMQVLEDRGGYCRTTDVLNYLRTSKDHLRVYFQPLLEQGKIRLFQVIYGRGRPSKYVVKSDCVEKFLSEMEHYEIIEVDDL